ncbi:hypothetical protein B0H19DRAFT_470150 [Mycena capillaripes]|nr:hypothetical protein B0H19DRAFT_470150 [Mycena capillaripes]
MRVLNPGPFPGTLTWRSSEQPSHPEAYTIADALQTKRQSVSEEIKLRLTLTSSEQPFTQRTTKLRMLSSRTAANTQM